MSNVVCLEEARARRMTPLRLIVLDVDDGQVTLTVTHANGDPHRIWMSPAKAECLALALQALAETARAEGSEDR